MKVYFYTLGCRLNQAESEAMADAFSKENFKVEKEWQEADLIVVNTCTVTSKAEQKARRMIRLFSKNAKAVIVTGCYAELNAKEINSLGPNLICFSLKEKASIMDLPKYLKENLIGKDVLFDGVRSFFPDKDKSEFSYNPTSFSYHSRAYMKVQDGCDNECGYCRVTIARGPSTFIDIDTAIKRAVELEKSGMHEIMLTGVNLTNYDHDGHRLSGLLKALLDNTGPGMRFRLSSMEPDNVDDKLLDVIKDSRVQPHFHIPVQSASTKVLEIANRKYSMEHLEYVIQRLREVKDDPFIAADIIAGLPGEGDEEFDITRLFVERMDFSSLHVFPYSPRFGTPLYEVPHPEERVRDERTLVLREIAKRNERKYIARQKGKKVELLFESDGYGTTGNYLKVKVKSEIPLKEGELYKAEITSLLPLEASVLL